MNARPTGESAKADRGTGGVQSVVRALKIVEVVANSSVPMRAKEIADAMDLHLATASHLLSSLVQMGYLDREKREYTLGRHKILALASKAEADWRPSRRQLELMQAVVAETGETTYISSLRRDTVSVDAIVEGTHTVRVAGLSLGTFGDVHARASGKVLLAYSDEEQRNALIAANGGLGARTPNSIVDPVTFLIELELTYARGYAVDHEEFALGVGGIAVPLFEGRQSPRRAMSITAPIHRFEDPSLFNLYTNALLKGSAASTDTD